LRLFSGKTIDVASLFIGRKSDWGTYSAPGALDLMRTKATTRMSGTEPIDDAGHWIQQEQPGRLSTLLLAFMKRITQAVKSGNAHRRSSISAGVQITVPSGPSRLSEALGSGGPGPALASGYCCLRSSET
jgi:hypothetical protein